MSQEVKKILSRWFATAFEDLSEEDKNICIEEIKAQIIKEHYEFFVFPPKVEVQKPSITEGVYIYAGPGPWVGT